VLDIKLVFGVWFAQGMRRPSSKLQAAAQTWEAAEHLLGRELCRQQSKNCTLSSSRIQRLLLCCCCSGSEGFFGEGDPNVDKNPQAWAKQTGQNFVDDNRHMDFAVTHAWPDNCKFIHVVSGLPVCSAVQ
jgi:hypothetical protein